MSKLLHLYWLPILLIIAGCQSTPASPGMKLGKPYVVDGRTYYPEYDPTYDKIGMASWYGPGFHGKYTASGEIFNQNDLTAAHPTLPMPSLVRVTNLSNGKSLIVRINDRGPFKSNRIIDLSKKAAQELGMPSTSQVRVQFLKAETDEYLASLQTNGSKPDIIAYNAQAARNKNSSIIHSTEPGDQVVESDVSNSRAGVNVSNAAPIVTVNSGDLSEPESVRKYHESVAKPVDIERNASENANSDESSNKQKSSIAALAVEPAYADEAPAIKTTLPEPSQSNHKGKIEVAGSASSTFYIQAGSFASEENAHKLSTRLEPIATIDVGKVEMGDKTWWRVRLGPYASKQEAASVLEKVHLAGLPDARIIQQ